MCATSSNAFDYSGFTSLFDLLETFNKEVKCIQYVASNRWGAKPVCQHCGAEGAYYLDGVKRFKCKSCRKQFSVRVNTIFHDSKIALKKWFCAIYLATNHKKGISSLQLSRDIKVTQKTAWFMLQCIRMAFGLEADHRNP